MRSVMAALAGLTASVAAAGCASDGAPRAQTPGAVNYAAGSPTGDALGVREAAALYPVFLGAVERGPAGKAAGWSAGSASGAVTPGRYFVANLKSDPATRLPVTAGLDLGERYETDLGLYALTSNANLRAGPSTEARVLRELTSGAPLDVVGRVIGKPWMLVAIDGAVSGYVHQNLMIRAPGSELTLAGGPTRRAYLCREFDQTLTVFGQTDRWTGAACDRGEGWRLESPANTALLN